MSKETCILIYMYMEYMCMERDQYIEIHIYEIYVNRRRPSYIWKEMKMALRQGVEHVKRDLCIDIHICMEYMSKETYILIGIHIWNTGLAFDMEHSLYRMK